MHTELVVRREILQNVVEPFKGEAPPGVHWPETSKVVTEVQCKMLVRCDACAWEQLEKSVEVRVHMVFVLLDLVFIDTVESRYFDSRDQMHEVVEPASLK